MPLRIIRNDITKVTADAIVNTANPSPTYGPGTDEAIYKAAGEKELLEARKKIGNISVGSAVITPGFHLHAKYIIHTVGPIWKDGLHGEYQQLEECYQHALSLAIKHDCKSIAFPLISSGSYGFPKEKALSIATSTISSFLLDHEMEVILVVFDRKAFHLSQTLSDSVQQFIDENYVGQAKRRSVFGVYGKRRVSREVYSRENDYSNMSQSIESVSMKASNIDDFLSGVGVSFSDKLFEIIDAKGLKDSQVYHDANMSKQTFSKIRTNQQYKPKKKTIFQLCIALKLNLDETIDLLSRADLAFNPSDERDLVIQYFIKNHKYDIYDINNVLFERDLDLLF